MITIGKSKRAAGLLTVLCTLAAVSGCSNSEPAATSTSTTRTATSTSPSAAGAPVHYDLARLAEVQGDLPPGFDPGPPSAPTTLPEQYVDAVGTVVSYGKPFTVEPAGCRSLLAPVVAMAGADTFGFRGDSPDGQSISVQSYGPVTVPAAISATGCDGMTFRVDDESFGSSGTVEVVAAARIDGATTIGLRVDFAGQPQPQYSYAALLDDGSFVSVQARLASSTPAEPLLPGLLVKAVAAVRGR